LVFSGGERRLRNVDGRCFFLEDAGCGVYGDRPAGCRFYPLVADGGGRVLVDPGCRYSDRFTVGERDRDRLRGFLKLIRRERRRELV
jgi:Fe-S-cluster containining protein